MRAGGLVVDNTSASHNEAMLVTNLPGYVYFPAAFLFSRKEAYLSHGKFMGKFGKPKAVHQSDESDPAATSAWLVPLLEAAAPAAAPDHAPDVDASQRWLRMYD